MNWSIRLTEDAQSELRQLKRTDAPAWDDAIQTIGELLEDPHPPGSIQLEGHEDLYRVRCCRGAYRIVYRVSPRRRLVPVTRVRARATAYQGLEQIPRP